MMRFSPLSTRQARRSSSCSSLDDHAIPAIRIPMIQIVMPLFLSALCIYTLIIVCTYPLLAGNENANHFERLVLPTNAVTGNRKVVDVQGVAPRNVREVEVQLSTSKPASRLEKIGIIVPKKDVIVKSLDTGKVASGRVKNVKGLVADTKGGANHTNADVVNGDNKGNDVVQWPVEPQTGVVIGAIGGGVDKNKQRPPAENRQRPPAENRQRPPAENRPQQVKIEVENKNNYNKLTTVPKRERYIDEPVDTHMYPYIHRPNVCVNADGHRLNIHLVFMVTTAPRNFERRQLIRETYGNERNWPVLPGGGFRTVFLLGAVANVTLQREIDVEFATQGGDIVQEDFVDSYANLTLKTVMGLKWVTNFCRQATFTMKIDDDSMIHQNRLLRMLKTATTFNFTAAETLIEEPVIRNMTSKYYLSKKYFPAPTYPPFFNSPGYIVSTDLAEGLYRVATSIPLFPWEDVFLGLCLKELGIVPQERHEFMLIVAEFSPIAKKAEAVKLFRDFTVVSNLEPRYMRLMWNAFHFQPSENK